MSVPDLLGGLGLSGDEDDIWAATHEVITSRGYVLKRAPGCPTPKLDEGGFAYVFYAEQAQNKMPLALKIFKDESKEALASFKREVEIMCAPDFPRQYAVTVHDSWHEAGSQPLIVMDYIGGLQIHEYCEQRKLPRDERIQLLEQVLTGLQRLHDANIVHRDISSGNVRIDERGNVRFLDFGLAGEIIRATRYTTMVVGKGPFMPPEMGGSGSARGDVKDDVYACGMLAIYVLTGMAPPQSASHSGDRKHLAHCRRQLRDSGVDGVLTSIVLQCLRRPEQRYSQPRAMAGALFDYRELRPKRIRSRRRALETFAVIGGTACVGALGWFRYSQTTRDDSMERLARVKLKLKKLSYPDHPAISEMVEEGAELEALKQVQLESGQTDEAWKSLEQAVRQYEAAVEADEKAVPVAEARDEYRKFADGFSAKSKNHHEYISAEDDAESAEENWLCGNWTNAASLFGQARQKLEVFRSPVNSIGMQLRLIPEGPFEMGSPEEPEQLAEELGVDAKYVSDEKQHPVEISQPFYLGVYEVTVGQFRQFVNDQEYHGGKNYQTEAERTGEGARVWTDDGWKDDPNANWDNPGFVQNDDHPVTCVSYQDALDFCAYLSAKEGVTYDLPTEAQWEYACRAGTNTRYPFGDDKEELAKYANVLDSSAQQRFPSSKAEAWDDGHVFTAPVGTFAPNGWDLYDMLGNVWEWTKDWYAADYYANSPEMDPTGPSEEESATYRVGRGGSWYDSARFCRSANRLWSTPDFRDSFLGFRVARGLSSE